ncbi:unnamed protein product [Pylaiella littoralis]
MLARAPASVREVLEDAKDIHMAWRKKVKEAVELGSAKDSGNRNDDQNDASMPPSELPTGGGDRKRRKDSLSTDTPVAAAAAAGSQLPDSSAPHSPKGRAIARKPSKGLVATIPGRSYVRPGSSTQAAAAAAAKEVAGGGGSGGGGSSSSSSSGLQVGKILPIDVRWKVDVEMVGIKKAQVGLMSSTGKSCRNAFVQ